MKKPNIKSARSFLLPRDNYMIENTGLTLGSLFDGIGGFPLAAVHNGITPVWASEIEPFPIQVTKARFPDMLHLGDITKLDGAKLPPVDIVSGGSPCQDLSVAGTRAGLKGKRSGLFMEQIRVIKEMRDADKRRGRTAQVIRPRCLIWENVPGAFSSAGGEDFRIVLEEIVLIKDRACSVPRPDSGTWGPAGTIVLGDQFSLAWRVLDAQYWGVPQRRKRIFLVADFAGLSAPKILFEQDSLPGRSAPCGGQGQGASAPAGESAEAPGGALSPEKKSGLAFAANQRDEVRDLRGVAGALSAQPGMKQQTFLIQAPLLCLNDQGGQRMDVTQEITSTLRASMSNNPPLITQAGDDLEVSACPLNTCRGGRNPTGLLLTAGFCAGAGAAAGRIGYQEETAPTLKGSPSRNMAPSILRLNDHGGGNSDCGEGLTDSPRAKEQERQPLVTAAQHGTDSVMDSGISQPALYENHGIDSRYTDPHPVAPTMSARYGTGGNNVPLVGAARDVDVICISGNAIDRQPQNGGNGLGCQSDISYTLTTTDHHAVFNRQRAELFQPGGAVSEQNARQFKDAAHQVMEVAGLDCRNGAENGDLCGTLQQGATGSSLNSIHPVRIDRLIRRLTPLECERLQGYPDGWTDLEGGSDSARYKALGNSVAVPCVDFILQSAARFLLQQEGEEKADAILYHEPSKESLSA